MNPGIGNDDPSIYYYDSDYPSPFDTQFPENFDPVTEYQGLAHDIERYRELVGEIGGPVLELCCGTGRVAIPLARNGFEITAVDINQAMLQRFRKALEKEERPVANRIQLMEQDITKLALDGKKFQTLILAFNSLLCIPDFALQCAALQTASRHLSLSGRLLIDIVNPLRLKLEGDPVPKPFFTRKETNTGNTYTRFAMMGPFETDHKQQLHGWYDEVNSEGFVKRRHYALYWRPIFRFEIELMLQQAGLKILQIEGGHRKEEYTAQSPRIFLMAGKG
jgi:ubiquinone/menaquinone biosynthesis C-methylase UbiE